MPSQFKCRLCGRDLVPWTKKEIFICASCSLAQQCPLPDDKELASIYSETYYDSWGEKNSTELYWEQKRLFFRRALSSLEAFEPSAKALDIGCATGACLSVFKDMGLAPYGIDLNQFAVRAAASLVPEAKVFEGTIENAPFEPNSFKLITMFDVLEHALDPVEFLRTVNRLLVAGGKAVVVTPDIESLSAKIMRSRWPHFKREHLFYFSGKSAAAAMEKAGFVAAAVRSLSKPISLEYAKRQFDAYPLPLITPALRLLNMAAPAFIRKKPLFFHMGEMLVTAEKRG